MAKNRSLSKRSHRGLSDNIATTREYPSRDRYKAENHRYRWRSVGYICTVAFDAILYYLRSHEGRNTRDTTLQEFQAFVIKNIDDLSSSPKS